MFRKYFSLKGLSLGLKHKPHVAHLVFSFNQQLGYNKEGNSDIKLKLFLMASGHFLHNCLPINYRLSILENVDQSVMVSGNTQVSIMWKGT